MGALFSTPHSHGRPRMRICRHGVTHEVFVPHALPRCALHDCCLCGGHQHPFPYQGHLRRGYPCPGLADPYAAGGYLASPYLADGGGDGGEDARMRERERRVVEMLDYEYPRWRRAIDREAVLLDGLDPLGGGGRGDVNNRGGRGDHDGWEAHRRHARAADAKLQAMVDETYGSEREWNAYRREMIRQLRKNPRRDGRWNGILPPERLERYPRGRGDREIGRGDGRDKGYGRGRRDGRDGRDGRGGGGRYGGMEARGPAHPDDIYDVENPFGDSEDDGFVRPRKHATGRRRRPKGQWMSGGKGSGPVPGAVPGPVGGAGGVGPAPLQGGQAGESVDNTTGPDTSGGRRPQIY
ncbi:hypothetical protein B0A49_00307 [Cryomyces minteri]|uniref:Uncharacterized protein n=1 Tax=Cryomyces minteri TaxID=331657 RepID=A0A4U0XZ61_9PEZI|nr:hypothetical protein B0A49_00307 [Cryomyces minteri]